MARFCTECGKEIGEGMEFCTECGTKVPVDSAQPVSKQPVTESTVSKAEAQPQVQPQAQVQQQNYQQTQQIYTQPVAPQPVYQQPAPDTTSKVVGTGAYFGIMLLFAIPIIGFIACIIMAFAAKNKNLKNYARAMLIWLIIALVIAGVLIVLFFALSSFFMDYINQLTNSQFGNFSDLFSQFGELGDTINEFGSITEQFENGGLNGIPLE